MVKYLFLKFLVDCAANHFFLLPQYALLFLFLSFHAKIFFDSMWPLVATEQFAISWACGVSLSYIL